MDIIVFQSAEVPAFAESLLFEIQKTGITAVFVYPERNHVILNDPNKLLSLVEKRTLDQLAAGSYLGFLVKKFRS